MNVAAALNLAGDVSFSLAMGIATSSGPASNNQSISTDLTAANLSLASAQGVASNLSNMAQGLRAAGLFGEAAIAQAQSNQLQAQIDAAQISVDAATSVGDGNTDAHGFSGSFGGAF